MNSLIVSGNTTMTCFKSFSGELLTCEESKSSYSTVSYKTFCETLVLCNFQTSYPLSPAPITSD